MAQVAKNLHAIGIDLGGSAVKGGLVAGDGSILHRESVPTEAAAGPDYVLDRIAALIETVRAVAELKNVSLAGVGIGAPGSLSHPRWIVIAPPNLPGWD